jgi:hypothetical protein
MAKKLLLCASTSHLSAAVWTGRRLVGCRGFEDDHAGQAAFQDLLRSTPGVPVYLMADSVDEDYRFETLPHVSGSDRREMVQRKLKQLYRSSPFYGGSLQQQDSDRRRDDRYLFAALTNPEIFAPWLQLLLATKAPVAGVFPLALVSLALVKRLGLEQQNVLLVSKHTAGIRQTFLKDQQFRISRLTPVRVAEGDAHEHYAEEIRNTRMYLDALNVTHVEDPVTIIIADQDGSLARLGERVVQGRRTLNCVYIAPQELVAKTGIDRASLDASQDALHLYLLGVHTPDLNLAPPALTAGYGRYQASRAIYAGAATLALAAMTWSGVNAYRALDLHRVQREAIAETQRQQQAYQEITRNFPQAPADAERLRQAVEVARRIEQHARLPDVTFKAVSQTLDSHPEIELTGLTWRHGRIPGTTDAAPGLLAQSAVLQVQLMAQPGDFKGALATINKFIKDLDKNDVVSAARTTKLPLNLASSARLSGSTAAPRREQPQLAQFEIEVVLKPGV